MLKSLLRELKEKIIQSNSGNVSNEPIAAYSKVCKQFETLIDLEDEELVIKRGFKWSTKPKSVQRKIN